MGRKKLRPDVTDEKMGINPLIATDFKVIVRKLPKKHRDKDGKEVTVDVELEFEKYVKVFVGADKRKVMCSLGNAAKNLFLWLTYELDSGKDWVWINRLRYMEEMNVNSVNTYKAGIEELVRKQMIAVSLFRDVYWINPRLFFCGNRTTKYPDHVEHYKPKKEFL